MPRSDEAGGGRPLRERFEAKVDRSGGPDACWLWTGGTQKSHGGGLRGKIREGGRGSRVLFAHRVALALATGKDCPDLEACHRCDHTLCCNPAHLFWGTHWENQQDYIRKHGRLGVPKRAA